MEHGIVPSEKLIYVAKLEGQGHLSPLKLKIQTQGMELEESVSPWLVLILLWSSASSPSPYAFLLEWEFCAIVCTLQYVICLVYFYVFILHRVTVKRWPSVLEET